MAKHVTLDQLQTVVTAIETKTDARFCKKTDLASAYRASGSIASSGLVSTLLVAENEGNVYNLTDALSITAANKTNFAENAEGTYPAGTNVVIIKSGNSYLFDVLAGFVDLSGKQDNLTAGSNIQINGSTISATDTTYSAGTNIQINGTTISATDTTYSDATTSASGLMSASDKSKLDGFTEATGDDITAIVNGMYAS